MADCLLDLVLRPGETDAPAGAAAADGGRIDRHAGGRRRAGGDRRPRRARRDGPRAARPRSPSPAASRRPTPARRSRDPLRLPTTPRRGSRPSRKSSSGLVGRDRTARARRRELVDAEPRADGPTSTEGRAPGPTDASAGAALTPASVRGRAPTGRDRRGSPRGRRPDRSEPTGSAASRAVAGRRTAGGRRPIAPSTTRAGRCSTPAQALSHARRLVRTAAAADAADEARLAGESGGRVTDAEDALAALRVDAPTPSASGWPNCSRPPAAAGWSSGRGSRSPTPCPARCSR